MLDSAIYSNSKETDHFLDKNKSTYMGSFLEMANDRMYSIWENLEQGLRTGTPQNEVKFGVESYDDIIYNEQEKL